MQVRESTLDALFFLPMHTALRWKIITFFIFVLLYSGISAPVSRRIASTSEYDHPIVPTAEAPEQCVLEHATVLIRCVTLCYKYLLV